MRLATIADADVLADIDRRLPDYHAVYGPNYEDGSILRWLLSQSRPAACGQPFGPSEVDSGSAPGARGTSPAAGW
ncbi:hypothetical protein Pa4123_89660 [Phytohabitans aurantiacus]|uniref:GNAT family N-acetyltransferase n=1 Tax=Phytohabitans aurantiacus TaxID=3016789 RepID=A0ABQ5RCM6_9ACTN|nr:hypothetical protein Pa4123_89660 [Phytohabitans aurantiacus]